MPGQKQLSTTPYTEPNMITHVMYHRVQVGYIFYTVRHAVHHFHTLVSSSRQQNKYRACLVGQGCSCSINLHKLTCT